MQAPYSFLLRLLQTTRQSSRLVQSVLLAFALHVGAVIAAPSLQAQNLSPDQQVICLGTGGMKIVTFAADGSISDIKTTDSEDCALCTALLAPAPAAPVEYGLEATTSAKPIFTRPAPHSTFQSRAPPARGPPAI